MHGTFLGGEGEGGVREDDAGIHDGKNYTTAQNTMTLAEKQHNLN
jgi:hypothetical protein